MPVREEVSKRSEPEKPALHLSGVGLEGQVDGQTFLAALPEGALGRFELRSLHAAGNVAYITWSVGQDIPLGTDTFAVDDAEIVSQTFAMHTASTAPPLDDGAEAIRDV